MNGDVYDAFDDPYVYKGTKVLKNIAGIRSQETLDNFELEMTTLAAETPLPVGHFDTKHFRAIHRHLFKDVYNWAGRYRTVRIAKGGNPFCYPEYIPGEMDKLFGRFGPQNLSGGITAEDFIERIANFLAELNAIHPFREGNGRTQLTYLALLSDQCGHPLELSRINKVSYLPAIIASFSGDVSALIHELQALLAD